MPTENRSSNTVQMVSVPRPGREHWDKLCALPRYMFLLRPSGKGVQKFEDPTGNWIDVHEAQKVMDAAMDEIAELRHLLNQPPADGFSAGDMADQGAKAFAARDPEVQELRAKLAEAQEVLRDCIEVGELDAETQWKAERVSKGRRLYVDDRALASIADPSAPIERDQGIPGTSFQRLNMLANQGE
ncbi:hypothetical protein [Pseudomonas sp. GZD-222]|uniref:hypothetical protein n=1 Tax=Pseudomonas sp. GZD-222 TaxID=3404805 RepID=UPI003BB728D8